jgi:hypothetical protein
MAKDTLHIAFVHFQQFGDAIEVLSMVEIEVLDGNPAFLVRLKQSIVLRDFVGRGWFPAETAFILYRQTPSAVLCDEVKRKGYHSNKNQSWDDPMKGKCGKHRILRVAQNSASKYRDPLGATIILIGENSQLA